jgi:mannosyltransferase
MKTADRLGILLVLLLGYALRVYRAGAQELRGDEAFGFFYSQDGYGQIIANTLALEEPHPVLSYFVYKPWVAAAGTSEFSLRFASALFSVAAVALLFRLAVEVKLPARIALVSALLLAVSPYAIWHSQDARMYGMSMALTLGSTVLAVIWLHNPRLLTGATYIAVSLLALHTHYFAAFIVLAQSLFVISQLLTRRLAMQTVWGWGLMQLVLWLLYAPWLLRARGVLTGYEGNVDSPALVEGLVRSLSVFAVGETVPLSQKPLWAGLAGAAVILGAMALGSSVRYRPAAWLFGFYLAVPVLAAWYGAQNRPIFDERYLAAAAPPFYALVAASLLPVRQYKYRGLPAWHTGMSGVVGAILIGGLLTGAALSLDRYYSDPVYSKTRGWRQLADTLHRLTACLPADEVTLVQNYPDPTLWYYFTGASSHIVLPPVAHDTLLARAEVDALVRDGTHWAMFVAQPAPNWDTEGIGYSALGEEFVRAVTDTSTRWPIAVYFRPGSEMASDSVEFENGVVLQGYGIAPDDTIPGGVVVVTLSWDVSGVYEGKPLKVSVQVLDQRGQLVAQEDRPLPQADVEDGEGIVTDSYGILLPESLPTGTHRVIAGLYRPESGGERILTASGADHIHLFEVAVHASAESGCRPPLTESEQR